MTGAGSRHKWDSGKPRPLPTPRKHPYTVHTVPTRNCIAWVRACLTCRISPTLVSVTASSSCEEIWTWQRMHWEGGRGQPCWIQGVESCPWNHAPLPVTVEQLQAEERDATSPAPPVVTRQRHISPVSMEMGSDCVVGWAGEEGCAWALLLPVKDGWRKNSEI